MTSYVALDIETTGLDENRDAIIEIGAVRFNERRVENEWTSLINPGRQIPDFITGLTGIDNPMVRQAPSFRDVAHELEAFVGDAAVIGHNVRFDLGFLQKGGILRYNEVVDTYELAAVLIPSAPRYNLGSLGLNSTSFSMTLSFLNADSTTTAALSRSRARSRASI